MPQELINVGLAVITSGCGWWLKNMWVEHRALEKEVAEIKTLVAGQYVRREELTAAINKIEASLDRNFQQVFAKLDNKADK